MIDQKRLMWVTIACVSSFFAGILTLLLIQRLGGI